jgi:hypothetical protein
VDAKVTSAGELKTNGVVSGKVAPALPPQPFSVLRSVDDGSSAVFLGPTTATVALTDLTFPNYFGNQARRLSVEQYSAAAPNAGCAFNRLALSPSTRLRAPRPSCRASPRRSC